ASAGAAARRALAAGAAAARGGAGAGARRLLGRRGLLRRGLPGAALGLAGRATGDRAGVLRRARGGRAGGRAARTGGGAPGGRGGRGRGALLRRGAGLLRERGAGQFVARGLARAGDDDTVGVAHGAAQQRADEQGDPADHDGDEGAAAQDVAAQVPDVGAGAEAPPGAAGQAAVDGVDRGPGDDQRRPGGEVDDVRRVVDRDALPADRDQQRGGEQGADHGGHALPAAEDGEDADDDLEEGDDEAGADGVFEGELPQRLGDFPGVQGVQPGDHGAALA